MGEGGLDLDRLKDKVDQFMRNREWYKNRFYTLLINYKR